MLRFNNAQIDEYFENRETRTIFTNHTKNMSSSNALPAPSALEVSRALGLPSVEINWLAGDGSDRCYYRITCPKSSEIQKTLVLMVLSGSDAAALKNNGYDWINISELLTAHDISVPKVIRAMPEHASLIIDDYGDTMLESSVFRLAQINDYESIFSLYQKAFDIITRFFAIPKFAGLPNQTKNLDSQHSWSKRSFDAERFAWELRFFMQKYALPVAGITLSPSESATFHDEVNRISSVLAANSKYFVHRDFHSRNLMVSDNKLAVIDFQDARLGPASYDIVSLCFDSYVPFAPATRRQLLELAIQKVTSNCGESVAQEISELWRPMLLQRQLKAIGSFGYLTIDKQKGDYLKYVHPALTTIEEQNIVDERWPFISSYIIRKLRDHLSQNTMEHP